jgi:hypothetical protein
MKSRTYSAVCLFAVGILWANPPTPGKPLTKDSKSPEKSPIDYPDQSNPQGITLGQRPDKTDVSPDGKYGVKFTRDGNGGCFYSVISRPLGRVLLQLKSSYQPDEDTRAGESFDVEESLSAVVQWSANSRFVAIDEANHSFEGTVLVAFLDESGKAQKADIPEEEIKKRSGQRWDRCRLHLGYPPWSGHGRIHLVLSGKVVASKPSSVKGGARSRFEQAGCDVALRIGPKVAIENMGSCE